MQSNEGNLELSVVEMFFLSSIPAKNFYTRDFGNVNTM
jgi:hypothetical protein